MNDESVKCKISFKGIENFLRRIAFNLGNTPSKTEVKIISCIPIDVTDLQQKIVTLEKQLDQALGQATGTKKTATFRTTSTSLPNQHCNFNSCHAEVDPCQHNSHGTKEQPCKECVIECKECNVPIPRGKPSVPVITEPPCVSFCNPINNDMNCCKVNANKKNIFKKTKKRKVPQKNSKTQLVYYAHTTHTPFKCYDEKVEIETRQIRKKQQEIMDVDNSFFERLMRRQYKPRPLVDQFSDTSNFTSPICRDTVKIDLIPPHSATREYDVCSFHNIDNVNDTNSNYMCHKGYSNLSIFYDSSLYDVVPVKEKPTKVKNKPDITNIKEMKYRHNFGYPSENTTKPNVRPLIINYHTVVPEKFKIPRNYPLRPFSRKEMKKTMHLETPSEDDTSRSNYVDCGEVYTKRNRKKASPPKTDEANKSPPCYKNAGCLTISVLDTECQTTTTESVQMDDSKTEQTLNQIKSILQSVLNEVKINSQIKITSEEKVKKDAVVQKGFSYGNIPECSNMLNSFTYNPYISPYANSCLHQIGQYCPSMPYPKCLHNFPVFIQSPGRNACSNYYKTGSRFCSSNQFQQTRHATTAGTNTDDNKNQNSETNKLIKEIYKSIALNIDMPTKDTSATEYDDFSSVKHDLSVKPKSDAGKFSMSSDETIESIPRSVFMRDIAINSSITPYSTKTYNSNLGSNTVSILSHELKTADTDRHFQNQRNKDRKNVVSKHLHGTKITRQPFENLIEEKVKYKKASSTDIIEDLELSSDEGENKEIGRDEPIKKKEKKNIFSKMFNSVKLLKNKNKKQPITEIVHEESEADTGTYDSDDYETVYSEKVNKTNWAKQSPTVREIRARKKTHSKIRDIKRDRYTDRNAKPSYSKQIRDRFPDNRRPYLEQEYRRQWNERLMFQDHTRSSSLQYYPKDTLNRMDSQRYQQNYDARSAVIAGNYCPPRQTKDAVSGAGRFRITEGVVPKFEVLPKNNVRSKGLSWFKNRKLGVQCGEQWKKIIFEG